MKLIKGKIDQIIFNKKWRKLNTHNYTNARNRFNEKLVSVGRKTYGAITVYTYNDINTLSIGNYCSIGPYVQFVLSADHRVDTISTYPFKTKCGITEKEGVSKGNIIIDDDVWIGANVIILSGVHIGQGAIIAAGAIVNKDVPPYAITGGVPAKVLRYKFEPEIVEALLKIDFSSLNDDVIRERIALLYEPITLNNYHNILENLPHKR